MSGPFVDTNLVVYVDDERDPWKMRFARGLWHTLAAHPDTMVSAQVVSESANTMLRLWGDAARVSLFVDRLENAAAVVPITPSVVHLALEGVARFGFAFYDAQIWAAAREWGATLVLSEDFADGLVADGVRFANPFVPGFDLSALLA